MRFVWVAHVCDSVLSLIMWNNSNGNQQDDEIDLDSKKLLKLYACKVKCCDEIEYYVKHVERKE